MPKRADTEERIDPVRARLVEAAAAPVSRQPPAKTSKQSTVKAERKAASKSSRGKTLTVNRKIMVSTDEAESMAEITQVVSEALGAKVSYSQISRALWSIVAGAEETIRETPYRGPKLSAPAKADQIAMAEFEDRIAEFLTHSMVRSYHKK